MKEHSTPAQAYDADVAVIGGGAVGIATARLLALKGREVFILERNAAVGQETSARNSEVIHAGLYYSPGSLKAKLCVRGRELLYDFCQQNVIAHQKCGKLVVATNDEQIPALEQLTFRAIQNGAGEIEVLDRSQLRQLEPELVGKAAILSPRTGVLDSASFTQSLLNSAEMAGATLACRSKVTKGQLNDDHSVTLTIAGDQPFQLRARTVVNAAGLWAADVNNTIDGFSEVPALTYVKGNYFAYHGQVPFRHLIYPMPMLHGLGVHMTRSFAGEVKFGPDTEPLTINKHLDFDYSVSDKRRARFAKDILNYWPYLDPDKLVPAYAGIRPKLSTKSEGDFQIERCGGEKALHVRLLGIESPGLTAALAIAEHVVELIE